MKNVLITGDMGYIGQHLKKMLADTRPDIKVYGFDIALDGMDVRLPYRLHQLRGINNKPITFDAIVHLAALIKVGESVERPLDYYETNFTGTMNVLRYVSCSNFIFASTGAASNPNSPYGYSKLVAEQCVQEYCKENGIDHTIFRFYNVIGQDGFDPTNPDGLFYNLKRIPETKEIKIYGKDWNTKDGTCVREYVHVNDICRAIIKAIDKSSNSIENLAYGDPRTVKEIVSLFLAVNSLDCTAEYLPRRPGDLESTYLPEPSEYMKRHYTYEDMLKI